MREVLRFKNTAVCAGCGHAPSYRAVVYAPLDEVKKRAMLTDGQLMSRELLFLLAGVKHTGSSPEELVVKLSETYSCNICWVELSRALSAGPSWVCVDIAKRTGDGDKFVRDLASGAPLPEATPQ